MPIAPPAENLLNQPEMELMDLFGRMRSLTDRAGFKGALPAVWQCSDESQSIKKALFGYVFDCPAFNLGRVGALLDPLRLVPASRHGHDLIILGGSHLGASEEAGFGHVERIHGENATCCGLLGRLLDEYLQLYRRAAALILLFRGVGGLKVEIPYKFLFRKPPSESARIHILLRKLIEGEALRESSHGKVYRLNQGFADRHRLSPSEMSSDPRPIGELLDQETFFFSKRLNRDSPDPRTQLEIANFDFLPDIVTSPYPHRRLIDVNTWRQFHRLASYLTDSFDTGERNILVVAGRTLDHTVKRNTFIPQFGFWMEQGQALQARYFNPLEINELLVEQEVVRPNKTFLEFAGVQNP